MIFAYFYLSPLTLCENVSIYIYICSFAAKFEYVAILVLHINHLTTILRYVAQRL